MIKYTSLDNMPPKKLPVYGPMIPVRPTFEAWWMHYMHLNKLADYMYQVWIPYADYRRAINYLDGLPVPNESTTSGGCSAFRAGKYHCRLLDYYYNEVAYFHVYIPRSPRTRHASMAIAGFCSTLTKEFVESGEWSDSYVLMPCFSCDGMNDAGVVVNQNNVSYVDNPLDSTKNNVITGTCPGRSKLPTTMVTRFLLDNAGSADEAVQLLYTVDIYTPEALKTTDCLHWLISDKNKSIIVEIVDNVIYTYDAKILTNFYITGWDGDTSNICLQEIEAKGLTRNSTVTPHANGLERYSYIKKKLATDSSLANLMFICNYLHYSNAYKRDTVPFWYSEYYTDWTAQGFSDLKFSNSAADFAGVVNYNITEYEKDERNGKTWRTCHTSIYNIEDLRMMIQVQETDEVYSFSLPNLMKIDVDKKGDMTKWIPAGTPITCTHKQLPPPPQYIDWDNILNKPDVFTPAPHKHSIKDITAGGYITSVQLVRPPCPDTIWLKLEFYSDAAMTTLIATVDQSITSDAAVMHIASDTGGYVEVTVNGFDPTTEGKHIIVDLSGIDMEGQAYARWTWYANDKSTVASSTFMYPSATPFDTIAMGLVTQGN